MNMKGATMLFAGGAFVLMLVLLLVGSGFSDESAVSSDSGASVSSDSGSSGGDSGASGGDSGASASSSESGGDVSAPPSDSSPSSEISSPSDSGESSPSSEEATSTDSESITTESSSDTSELAPGETETAPEGEPEIANDEAAPAEELALETTDSVEPEVEATEPEVEATEPEAEVTEPAVEATEPEVEATEPEVGATEEPIIDSSSSDSGSGSSVSEEEATDSVSSETGTETISDETAPTEELVIETVEEAAPTEEIAVETTDASAPEVETAEETAPEAAEEIASGEEQQSDELSEEAAPTEEIAAETTEEELLAEEEESETEGVMVGESECFIGSSDTGAINSGAICNTVLELAEPEAPAEDNSTNETSEEEAVPYTHSASVSPYSVKGEITSSATFTITNNGPGSMDEITLQRPSGVNPAFYIDSSSINCPSGWSVDSSSSSQEFAVCNAQEGSGIAAGGSVDISLDFYGTGIPECAVRNWNVVSENDAGAVYSSIVAMELCDPPAPGHTHNASVSPTSVAGGSTATLTYAVANNGPSPVWRIRVDRPSGSINFNIQAPSINCGTGWHADSSSNQEKAICDANTPADNLEAGQNRDVSFDALMDNVTSCTSRGTLVRSRDTGTGDGIYDSEVALEICPPVVSITSVAPITIVATKIVCNSESDLPNWGAGGPDVTATTASDFLAAHPNCRLESGWNFQWGFDAANPGDNTGAALGWNTFGPTDASGTASAIITPQAGILWAREVWQEGYIPFTGQNTNQPVSAEIYCATDVLNYDNYERIDNAASGNTYYCVAFNAPATGTLTVYKIVTNDNGGQLDPNQVPLFVDGNPVSNGAPNELEPSTYTVSETQQQGYSSSLSGDCDSQGSVTLGAGENKVCTITNNDEQALVFVKKQVINHEGDAVASDFTMIVNATNGSVSFPGFETGVHIAVSPGSYNVYEIGLEGYNATYSEDCSGQIALGEVKNCTITNEEIVQQLFARPCGAQVDLCSWDVTLPLGSPYPQCNLQYNTFWPLNTDSTATCTFDGSQFGSHTLYFSVDNDVIECTLNGVPIVQNFLHGGCALQDPRDGQNISITPLAGTNTIICTVHDYGGQTFFDACVVGNGNPHGTLIVTKHVVNDNGGSAVASDFNMSISTSILNCTADSGNGSGGGSGCGGASGGSFPGDENGTVLSINVGDYYSVGEQEHSEYGATYSGDCNGTISNGETKYCTVTNDDFPAPVCDPQLELIANGGFENPEVTHSAKWDIFNDGTSGLGWSVAWMSPPGTVYNSVTIPEIASLELHKTNVIGGAPYEGQQYTELDGDWQGPDGSLNNEPASTRISQAIATIPGEEYTLSFAYSPRQAYGAADNVLEVRANGVLLDTLSRAGTGGTNWTVHSYAFIADSSTTVIEFSDAGTRNSLGTLLDDVSLLCSPAPPQAHLTVYKVVVNNDTGNKTVEDFPLFVDQTQVTSGVSNSLSPGTYAVSETQLEGYTSSFSGDCDTNGTIALNDGDNKTCTITNDDVRQLFARPCGVQTDLCTWTEVLPLGSEDVSSCGLSYNTLWSSPSERTLNCTFDGSQYADHTLYFSIDNDVIECTLNGVPVVQNFMHEGCALQDPRSLQLSTNGTPNSVAISPLAGANTITCRVRDRHVQSFFDACVVGNGSPTGALTVTKVVINDDQGTAQVSDFPLFVDETQVTSGAQNEFAPGAYAVSETQLEGYTSSFSGDCDTNGSINLSAWDNKTCTITNDDIPAPMTCVNFESLATGSSVEGLGTVDPLLNINSIDGTAVVLAQGVSPVRYTAPNYLPSPIKNACLGNPGRYALDGNVSVAGKAFSETDGDSLMNYTFTFAPGVTMDRFSLDMRDFGDWNPFSKAFHKVRMVAYDSANSTVDEAILSFNSTTATLPRSSPQYGDLYYTGDACTANASSNVAPGNWNFEVTGAGITRVELQFLAGLDPNTALDNLCYRQGETIVRNGTITVYKVVVNNDTGNRTVEDFPLFVDQTQVTSGTPNSLSPGTYVVSESQLEGYTSSFSGDCNENGTIVLGEGESRNCTITNDDIPRQPLTCSCTGGEGDIYADCADSFQQGKTKGGTSVLAIRSDPAKALHANQTNGSSDDTEAQAPGGTFTSLGFGGNLTLCFNNEVENRPGNDLHIFETTYTNPNYPERARIEGSSDGYNYVLLNASIHRDGEVDLDLGPLSTLKFIRITDVTNKASSAFDNAADGYDVDAVGEIAYVEPPVNGTITVNKIVVNDNGGSLDPSQVPLFVDGNPVTNGAQNTFAPGTYAVSESQLEGYTSSFSGDCNANGTIVLSAGDEKNCTITNDDLPGTLVVYKHVVNDNGGTLNAPGFNITVNGTDASPSAFAGDENGTVVLLDAGYFSVDELAQYGYEKSFSQVCDYGEEQEMECVSACTGTIANGQTLYCTITNDDIAPRLTVTKHVINDNSGTKTASDFTMQVTGTNVSNSSFAGAESPGTTVTLDAGSYSVDEAADSGYTKSLSTDCSGTIAIGETKSCTITNDDNQPGCTGDCGGNENNNGGGPPVGYSLQQSLAGGGETPPLEFAGGSNNTTNVTEPVVVLAPIGRAPLWEIPGGNETSPVTAPVAAALFDNLPDWIWLVCPIAVAIVALILWALLKKRKKKGDK